MGLFLITMMFVARAAALLIDWLLLLLLVRVVATRWQAVILKEVNDAARPMVDRAVTSVERMWNQIRPAHRLRPHRRIPTVALTLSVARLLLTAVTGLVVTVG